MYSESLPTLTILVVLILFVLKKVNVDPCKWCFINMSGVFNNTSVCMNIQEHEEDGSWYSMLVYRCTGCKERGRHLRKCSHSTLTKILQQGIRSCLYYPTCVALVANVTLDLPNNTLYTCVSTCVSLACM